MGFGEVEWLERVGDREGLGISETINRQTAVKAEPRQ